MGSGLGYGGMVWFWRLAGRSWMEGGVPAACPRGVSSILPFALHHPPLCRPPPFLAPAAVVCAWHLSPTRLGQMSMIKGRTSWGMGMRPSKRSKDG